MRLRRRWFGIGIPAAFAAIAVVVAGVYAHRLRPIGVATGTVAQTLCTEVFVAHLDADAAYREILAPEQRFAVLSDHLRWSVDMRRQEVRRRLVREIR